VRVRAGVGVGVRVRVRLRIRVRARVRVRLRKGLERVAADALRIVDAPGAAGGAVEGG
jgi:hypothetical protein